MNPRLVVVALALIAGGATALVLSGGEGPAAGPSPSLTPAAPNCLESPTPPARISMPTWVPRDLELPAGTFTIQKLPAVQGLQRGIFAVPVSLDGFVELVLNEWPKDDWVLGRGEREPGEAEDTFFRDEVFGQFRVLEIYCDRNLIQMLLVMGKNPAGSSPAPTYSPIPPNRNPSVTPSPLKT